MNEKLVRRELERIESRLAFLQAEINRATGIRDTLVAELLDSEGTARRIGVGTGLVET